MRSSRYSFIGLVLAESLLREVESGPPALVQALLKTVVVAASRPIHVVDGHLRMVGIALVHPGLLDISEDDPVELVVELSNVGIRRRFARRAAAQGLAVDMHGLDVLGQLQLVDDRGYRRVDPLLEDRRVLRITWLVQIDLLRVERAPLLV